VILVPTVALSAFLLIPIASGSAVEHQDPASTTINSILRLERAWEKAIASNDQAEIDRTVSADYVFVSLAGEVLDKAKAQTAKLNRLASATATIKEIQVRPFGASAVVVGLTREVTKGTDLPVILQYRWTHVLVRRNEAWQVVSEQWTRVN